MLLTYLSKTSLRKRFFCFLVYAALVIIFPLSTQNSHAAEVTLAWNLSTKAAIGNYYDTSAHGSGGVGCETLARLYQAISSSVANVRESFFEPKSSMLFFKHKRFRKYHNERYKTLKMITGWALALAIYCLNHLKISCLVIFGIAALFVFLRILKTSIKRDVGSVGRIESGKLPCAVCTLLFVTLKAHQICQFKKEG